MDELGKYFAHELEMISQAPVAFLVAVTAILILLWKFLSKQYENRLADAASRNQLLQDRIDDYKEKLSGATPDEARARMDALEARIEALGPRRINGDQRRAMVPILETFRGAGIIIATDGASADAAGLKNGLNAAFQQAGWIVSAPMVLGVGNPPPSGIGLIVEDKAKLSPPQYAIIEAFKAAGIHNIDIQGGHMMERRPDHPPPVAQIILTAKADAEH